MFIVTLVTVWRLDFSFAVYLNDITIKSKWQVHVYTSGKLICVLSMSYVTNTLIIPTGSSNPEIIHLWNPTTTKLSTAFVLKPLFVPFNLIDWYCRHFWLAVCTSQCLDSVLISLGSVIVKTLCGRHLDLDHKYVCNLFVKCDRHAEYVSYVFRTE